MNNLGTGDGQVSQVVGPSFRASWAVSAARVAAIGERRVMRSLDHASGDASSSVRAMGGVAVRRGRGRAASSADERAARLSRNR